MVDEQERVLMFRCMGGWVVGGTCDARKRLQDLSLDDGGCGLGVVPSCEHVSPVDQRLAVRKSHFPPSGEADLAVGDASGLEKPVAFPFAVIAAGIFKRALVGLFYEAFGVGGWVSQTEEGAVCDLSPTNLSSLLVLYTRCWCCPCIHECARGRGWF